MDDISDAPRITEAERRRRERSISSARTSVRLKGFILDAETERLNERYIAGEIDGSEHSAAIRQGADIG